MNLLYEPSDGEIEYWSELTHVRVKTAAEAERNRIVGIIKERLDVHRGFVNGALDAGVEVSGSVYTAMTELNAILREIENA